MKRTIWLYGSISGAVIIGSMIVTMNLAGTGSDLADSEWLGYLTMIVALSVIFLGVKRYRDQELGGVIRFGTAFMLGLGIAAVASLAYVIIWEVYLSATDYAFMRDYTQSILEARMAEGLSDAAMQVEIDSMNKLEAQYANPLYRLPITFLEIFPVGLLVALGAAGVLRNSKVLPAHG